MMNLTDYESLEAQHYDSLTSEDRAFLKTLKRDIRVQCAKIFHEITGKDVEPMVDVNATIHGWRLNDMYDHAPGLAYYETCALKHVAVPDYAEFHEIRDVSYREFRKLSREYSQHEEHDGLFYPLYISITAPGGGVIALYEKGEWCKPCMTALEWSKTQQKIQSLHREAAEDMRNDCDASAKRKREEADFLSLKLSLSIQRLPSDQAA
ncbi:hypothetical protein ACT3UJ_06275 [Halomonas sp. 86]|uniref:hypothetical protein n=1 Tax=unclassified Halomonas TaxID=2609666 RepID=UPI004034653C